MVFVLLVFLLVVIERASVEIGGSFGVPVALKLEQVQRASLDKGGAARTLMARSTMATTSSEPYW